MSINTRNDAVNGPIGRRVARKEDDRLLRGQGNYVDDVPEPPGTLHLAFVLSPVAHARIRSIDIEAAAGVEGVVAIYTGAHFLESIKPIPSDIVQEGYHPVSRPAMAYDQVRFAGEAVAVVVAQSRYLAEDGVDLVRVEYEELPPVLDVDAAIAPDAVRIHDGTTSNVRFQSAYKTQGFDEVYAQADLVVQDVFYSSRLAAVSMEPRGCLGLYTQGTDSLTLWTSTQIPHIVRTGIANLLNWPEERLRVVAPDVGGGFGMKAYMYPEELIVSQLARELNTPIKWICDRREDLITSSHGRDYRFNVELAFSREGILLAAKAKIHCNIGAYAGYPFGASAEAGGGAIYLPGPYRMQHYAYETCAVSTNTCPTGVYRGVAAPVAAFATESLMDRAASDLNLDPAELRQRNVLVDADIPYINSVNIKYSSGSFSKCLNLALEASDYAEFCRTRNVNRMRDGKLHGIGIGNVIEHTGQGASRYRQRGIVYVPGFDGAHVKIEPNGKAIAWVSCPSQGQGHATSFAQVIASQLGLEFSDVTIIAGDTAIGPYGSGAFASRAAVVVGGAVFRASGVVAHKLRRIAAAMLEADAADIDLADGYARIRGTQGTRLSIKDLASVAYSMHSQALPAGESFGLEATDYFDPPEPGITNATHVAQVSIDISTGRVSVDRYVVAHDCGRIINPTIVDGQIHGGVVQGISSVLSEAIRYSGEGKILTTSLMDYLVSSPLDAPDTEVLHEESWSISSGGFKGVGEGGVIGALPAVANAITDALAPYAPRITQLPILPHRIIEIIKAAHPGEAGRHASIRQRSP